MMAPDAAGASVRLSWAIRVAVSALALTVIFHLFPMQEVVATIRRIALIDWMVTLGIFLVGHTVSAAKWELLASSGAGFRAVLRAHFGGLISNLYLPGVAGGDVVRAALLYRRAADKGRLALGSVADRLIDTVGLLLIAAVGLVLALGQADSSVTLLAWIGISLAALGAGGVATVKIHPLLLRRLPPDGRLSRIGKQLSNGIVLLSAQKSRLFACLVLSMLVQACFIAATIGLARAAGVESPVAAWFFAWPLSKLIATLPISIAGIGVREASLAGFLAPFGAAPAEIVGIGLLWQTVQLAGAFLGGFALYLHDRALSSRTRARTATGDANESR
jgi:uncharacterized protein (TIRG00374 family)